ncbi:MAG: TolC family protein, partial [Acinetobacter sp.]
MLAVSMLFTPLLLNAACHAQSISFQQAEQSVLQDSYTTKASQALQQASQLEAEAIKGLGLPRVDLNVRAYAFHNEMDVPLGAVKNNLEQSLSDGVNNQINEWQSANPNIGGLADPLKDGLNQTIHNGVGLIPDESQVVLDDQVIRPTVSVMMPLYTGGLTSSAKEAANIKAQRSQLNAKQQQDVQRYEL